MNKTSPIDNLKKNEWDRFIFNILKRFLCFCSKDTLITREDLEQEAWIALMVAAEKYDESKSKFTTFAYIYINGYLLTYVGKKTKNKPGQVDETPSMVDIKSYEDNSAENNDFMSTVLSLVEDEESKNLLIDHFVNNKSYRYLADKYKISRGTVSNRINDTLSSLKQKLNNENSKNLDAY